MKFIHLECLKKWIISKLNIEEDYYLNKNVISILWENFKCELCLKKIPLKTIVNNKEYSIFNAENFFKTKKFFNKYCVLEGIDKNMKIMGLYLCNLENNNTITIGRSTESKLLIRDISVSRNHA